MMKWEDSEEINIDLDSDDPDESSDREDPQPHWKAPAVLEGDQDNIHTSTLLEISDTKPLLNIRDPRGINDCLKVTFEDVIAEPVAVRSGDRIWMWSNALFEVTRVWIYRIASVLMAIPMSLISGILFAILSCLHIWMVGPCIQCILVGTCWLQSLWNLVLDIIMRPFLTSTGKY